PQYYQHQFRVRPGREALVTVRRPDDGSYTAGLGQRLQLGGPARPAPRRQGQTHLQEVKLEGARAGQPLELGTGVTEAELRGTVRAKPGRPASYFDLQDDSERIRQLLVQKGYLEAVVEPVRQAGVAVFRGRPGQTYPWRGE